MRNTIAAAAIAMLASSGSAFAADCTKGLLWPYVRNPGDCLTEQELKTGVYQGAPQGPVDVGNIKSPVQPAMPITAQDCHETGIWPFRSEECTPVATTSAKISAPPAPQPAVANTTPAAPAPVAQTAQPVARTQAASAPTTTEQVQAAAAAAQAAAAAAQAAAAAAQAAAVAAQAAAAATPVVVTQPTPAPAPVAAQAHAAPTTASCSKGLLWPFVRDAGDCPTETERAHGITTPVAAPASAQAAATPAAMPITAQDCHETGIWPFRSEECTPVVKAVATSSPPPAPQPTVSASTPAAPVPVAQSAAPVAAQCTKGVLWPFVRDAGDCPTETERAHGITAPVAAPASATAAATPAAMPAVVQTGAAPAAASCGKSWLWPFVRDSGDCATAVEKTSGATAPVSSNPAVVPASATAPPPAAASQPPAAPAETGCHKGLFWPFVREPGDCPTSSDQGQTRSGRS